MYSCDEKLNFQHQYSNSHMILQNHLIIIKAENSYYFCKIHDTFFLRII